MTTDMAITHEEFLWVEKYRPKTIRDCILSEDIKVTLQEFVNNKQVPNLLLCGSAGVGKTTVARAMLEEIGADYIIINGSLNGGIDTLRTTITGFASTVSMWGGRKYVILDEADYLTQATQPALRNFIEQFSHNCGFIFTCNYKNRIIEPLHSRCSVIEFKVPKKALPDLAKNFFSRACEILTAENIKFDKNVVIELILRHVPDWRRVLNELQKYSAKGEIDAGLLANLKDFDLKDLIKHLKAKDFTSMRTWVGHNSTVDQNTIYRQMYDMAYDVLKPTSIPQLVIILADYQYKAAFAVVPEINLAACLTQIMMECEWK